VNRSTRRQFLRAGGGAIVTAGAASQLGWLAGCGGNGSKKPDWAALEKQLNGKLVRPGDAGYRAAGHQYNARYAAIRPQGVALCAGAADAPACVVWSQDNDVPVSVRSGGHNYAAYSTGPGLVIDVGGLRTVVVDDAARTVTAGPGARNTTIYAGLQPHGVAISAGRCPTVAVGGLVLGGGIGFSSRKLGLTCDHLVEAEMVTAAGKVVRASEKENPDLFWALRGGGGGNYGVCTKYVFETRPVRDVGLYDLAWEWADAPAVFEAFQEVMARAPDEFSARLGVGRAGQPDGSAGPPSINALGQYFGPVDELRELLEPALRAGKTTKRLIAPRTFWQAKDYFFHTTPRDAFGVKSAYLDKPLAGAGVEALLRAVDRWPGSTNDDGAGAAMFGSGGAINHVPADATAFVHRSQFAVLAMETSWEPSDPRSTVDANLEWLDDLGASMRPFVSGSAYQNFIDRTQPNWQEAYYGANFDRLVRVKRKWDPDEVFRFQQSIPSR
jgi:FAD/FMN-containing dehydrogenase